MTYLIYIAIVHQLTRNLTMEEREITDIKIAIFQMSLFFYSEKQGHFLKNARFPANSMQICLIIDISLPRRFHCCQRR